MTISRSFLKFIVPKMAVVLICGAILSAARSSEALFVSQEEFVDDYKNGTTELVLMGAGLKRFLVLKMVAVGLYLEKGIEEGDILKNVPKRIEVAYLQKISKQELQKETVETIKDNVDEEKYKILEPQINLLNDVYTDVDPGDRFAFTYIPAKGTQIELNGVELAMIEGEDFAFALFSIYIGVKPADNRVKGKLLGRLDYYK